MADKKNNKPRGFKQPQGQPGGPRRWMSLIFYAIAFAILGFYFFGNKEGSGASKELSYTKLTAYIEAGAIEKIEVTDDLQASATELCPCLWYPGRRRTGERYAPFPSAVHR